jgi:hypothetical protein
MQAFQQRVVEEQTDLSGKIDRLRGFLEHNEMFLRLSTDEQERMKLQLQHMLHYHDVLCQRIAAFGD